ncbi:hypothetical protein [Plantibacter sp. RU18]|uniref:hypothetical protein n=1 Tax=Plantibacter sp. RU18 TaxID=3158143 RepID=UPI003D36AB37
MRALLIVAIILGAVAGVLLALGAVQSFWAGQVADDLPYSTTPTGIAELAAIQGRAAVFIVLGGIIGLGSGAGFVWRYEAKRTRPLK